MMKKSLTLSRKFEGHFESLLVDLFSCTSRLSIPAFVVGATARDILFDEYGIETGRATRDLDIAIQVENWDYFTLLKKELLETDRFSETRAQHRIKYFKDDLNVDVIPFGGIADSNESILWPPDHSIKMTVVGFEEAFQTAISAQFPSNPNIQIIIASIIGLTLLKIISWDENYPLRKKDAIDLEFMMRNYTDAGNHDRFYEEMSGIIESESFDYESASSRLLGRDLAKIAKPKTKAHLVKILKKQTGKQDRYFLAEDMISNQMFNNSEFERTLSLVESFNRGLCESL